MTQTLSRTAAQATTISRRRKAAVILQYLINEGRELPLAELPEPVQVALTLELGALSLVDRQTLDSVVREFADQLEALALSPGGGTEAAVNAIGAQISPAAQARLRADISSRIASDPWDRLRALPPVDLVSILESEAVEVAAVLLSKLPVAMAADLLGRMSGDRARQITLAVSLTAAIQPETVARIGRALAEDHCDRPELAFAAPPVQRVGAILNSSLAQTRDAVLAGLGQEAPEFAQEVRKAIFTFADIPARVTPAEMSKAIRSVEPAQMLAGLAFALAQGEGAAVAAEFILANISQRLAEQLREDIAEKGKIRPAEGEAALMAIVTAIREKADAGDIRLIDTEEPD
jgi:flagellar motor switch protein FliG